MKTTELQEVAESLLSYPVVSVELATKLAKQYYGRYAQRRGSMVVDVVASAWRNYDRVENHIVPTFERSVRAQNLKSLAKEKRPATLNDDEKIVKAWAKYAEPFRFDTKSEPYVGAVKKIGPALFAYLRMRAGADAIKADVWVARVLEEHGATFKKATDVIEVTRYAEAVAEAMGVSRLVLDQMLWRGEWKITQHALDELEKTAAWVLPSEAGTRVADCPLCGGGRLKLRVGKFGPFYGCSSTRCRGKAFRCPSCRDAGLVQGDREHKCLFCGKNAQSCPKCGVGYVRQIPAGVSSRTGRKYGAFNACSTNTLEPEFLCWTENKRGSRN